MSHLYPIAKTAEEAFENAANAARTRYEAEALADGREIIKLETEWISPGSDDILAILDAAEAGPGHGFVQQYEDESGAPVIAVTYWKIGETRKPARTKPEPKAQPQSGEDHTDDLYFRSGRTKPARKRGRKKYVDPRQLDMFPQAPAADDSAD